MKHLFRLSILLLCIQGHAQGTYTHQPAIESRAVDLLHEGQLTFKDLNKNNRLDAYEDWRLPVEQRIGNLLGQMTLEEKVGMLLINTLNAGEYGHMTDRAVQFIEDEKMTRFVFRNVLKIRCWPLISDNPMFWIKIPES